MSEQTELRQVDLQKRAAMEEIENLKVIRVNAWEEHTHSFRWLMASLLAINGAACLAVLDQSDIPIENQLWAGAAFAVGILAALLVAVFGQKSVQKSLSVLQKMIGYWMAVAEDGERDEDFEKRLNEEVKASAKSGLGSRIVGWISAIAFVGGAAAAGLGMYEQRSQTSAQVKQKQTIEQLK